MSHSQLQFVSTAMCVWMKKKSERVRVLALNTSRTYIIVHVRMCVASHSVIEGVFVLL